LLQRLAIIGMHPRHEAFKAADRAFGNGKDAAGLGGHSDPAAAQVDDPAAHPGDRLRALELGFAGLDLGGALRQIAAQSAHVINALPVRTRQENDQQHRNDDAGDLHQAVEDARRWRLGRQQCREIGHHKAKNRGRRQGPEDDCRARAQQPTAHQNQHRVGYYQQRPDPSEERRQEGHGQPQAPDQCRQRSAHPAAVEQPQGARCQQHHGCGRDSPPVLIRDDQQHGQQNACRRKNNGPGGVPEEA